MAVLVSKRASLPGATYAWLQYVIVEDGQVTILEMSPTVFGWNVARIIVQGQADWPNMTAEQIRAFKGQADDGHTQWLAADQADEIVKLRHTCRLAQEGK